MNRLFVVGLATDYCVLASVLDARSLGYAVVLLRDAVAAVDVTPGDGERALARMAAEGAATVDSASLQPPPTTAVSVMSRRAPARAP